MEARFGLFNAQERVFELHTSIQANCGKHDSV